MPNQFNVGDRVVVARMPVDVIYHGDHPVYHTYLIGRIVLTIKSMHPHNSNMCDTVPEVRRGCFTCVDCLELESNVAPSSVGAVPGNNAIPPPPPAPVPSSPWVAQPWVVAQPVPSAPWVVAQPVPASPVAPHLGAPVPYQEEQAAVFIADADKPYRKGMPDSEKQLIESRLAVRRALRGY